MTKEGYVVYADKTKSQFQLIYTVGGGCEKGCTSCTSTTNGCNIKTFGPFTFNNKEFEVKNGNSVEVEIYPSTHLVPSVLILMFPLLEFFLAYWLHSVVSFNIFVLSSVVLVASYFIVLILFNKKWKNRIKGEVTKIIR